MVQLGGPYIPLKTGRRDGRKSRAAVVEEYLPDHNESISVVLERFSAMGINTPGVVALLGMYTVPSHHPSYPRIEMLFSRLLYDFYTIEMTLE